MRRNRLCTTVLLLTTIVCGGCRTGGDCHFDLKFKDWIVIPEGGVVVNRGKVTRFVLYLGDLRRDDTKKRTSPGTDQFHLLLKVNDHEVFKGIVESDHFAGYSTEFALELRHPVADIEVVFVDDGYKIERVVDLRKGCFVILGRDGDYASVRQTFDIPKFD